MRGASAEATASSVLMDQKDAFALPNRSLVARVRSVMFKWPIILLAIVIVAAGIVFAVTRSSEAGVSRYAVYKNKDSLSVGDQISYNNSTTLAKRGEEFRLLMGVDEAGLPSVVSPLVSISIGGETTCGLTGNQEAYCWGRDYGNTPKPVAPSGVLAGKKIKIISVGGNAHYCALTYDNEAYCWGSNHHGQIGDGTTDRAFSPVAVDMTGALSGKTIATIHAGSDRTCVITTDHRLYCWGINTMGQLGLGNTNQVTTPAEVGVGSVMEGKDIVAISGLGFSHTCALDVDGAAYCWGSNANGQLGNETNQASLTPLAVYTGGALSGQTLKTISVSGEGSGGHSCALSSDNLGYCWGNNANGRLGNGSSTSSSVPVSVSMVGDLDGRTLRQITTGLRHVCAVSSDYRAYCWGYNTYGQTASSPGTVPSAVDASGVLAGKDIVSIGGGARHSCALDTDGAVYCWGYGAYGNMGNGGSSYRYSPVATNSINTVEALSLSLQLQYAAKTATTCKEQQDGFLAVNNSSPIAYNANPSVIDRTPLEPTSDWLVTDPELSVSQLYVSSDQGSFSNPRSIPYGNVGVWDFSLKDNTQTENTTYCLRMAFADGEAFGSYTSVPEITTASNSNSTPHRFYQASNELTPGRAASEVNGDFEVPNMRQPFRLRMGVGIGAAANETSYKLHYAELSASTCNDQLTGYSDVTSDSIIAYYNNSHLTDRSLIAPIGHDVDADSYLISSQSFISSGGSAFSNPHSIAVGEIGVWDFSLVDNSHYTDAPRVYCLRIVNSDGSLLDNYSAVAQLKTANAPQLTSGEYGFYKNTNSLEVGDSLSGKGEDAQLTLPNESFRLKTGFTVDAARYSGIASGEYSTCALSTTGQVDCWGENWYGQLGDGTYDRSLRPKSLDTTGVLAGKTVKKIASGRYHACALVEGGGLYCWGSNGYGQLGDGTTSDSPSPKAVDVSGALAGKTIKDVTAYYDTTCVVASDNMAYCWGYNNLGQLGDGTANNSTTPVAVGLGEMAGLTIKNITLGLFHACAIASDDQMYCWGNNGNGQQGNGTLVQNTYPTKVGGGVFDTQKISSVGLGYYHTCAVTDAGKLYCWGNNKEGKLGVGSTTQYLSPVEVDMAAVFGSDKVSRVVASKDYTCAISVGGLASCWGYNASGQLATGTITGSAVPQRSGSEYDLIGTSDLSVSQGGACAIGRGGQVFCWGGNYYGQLGDNTYQDSLTPILITNKQTELQPDSGRYKLQYTTLSQGVCEDMQAGYIDVTNSTPIAFAGNQDVANGSSLNGVSSDFEKASAQTYISQSGAFTTVRPVWVGEQSLFDFSLRDNGSPLNTTYCLRIVREDGTTLGSSGGIPAITTAASRHTKPSVNIDLNNNTGNIAGYYDASFTQSLRVKIGSNGQWYTLGVDDELSTDGDEWKLSLEGLLQSLSAGDYVVYVETTTLDGVVMQASGGFTISPTRELAATGSNYQATLAIAVSLGGLVVLSKAIARPWRKRL